MCHMSHVTCQVSVVRCHVSHDIFSSNIYVYIFWDKLVELFGGGSVNNGANLAPNGSPLFMMDGFLDGRFQKKFLTDY